MPEESIWTSALATTARFLDSRAQAERFPYRPSRIVESVADLVDELAVSAAGVAEARQLLERGWRSSP